MKPTSIIFLIISLVLIILGVTVTGVAKRLAAADDVQLVVNASDEENNSVFTYQYNEDNIAKIALNLKNAKVNIIGGAETPYIELKNFSEGMYGFSATNRVITVNDNVDFTSLSGVASLASNFKGLRGFVNHFKLSKLEKTVNVYLCPEYPVNVIDCKVESGEVNIASCISFADYNVSIGDGKLTVTDVETSSLLNISIGTGSANIQNSRIAKFSAAVENGSVTFDSNVEKLNVNIATGDFICNYPGSLDMTNLKLFTNVGKITIDGVQHSGYKEATTSTENLLHINIGTGDIDITSK